MFAKTLTQRCRIGGLASGDGKSRGMFHIFLIQADEMIVGILCNSSMSGAAWLGLRAAKAGAAAAGATPGATAGTRRAALVSPGSERLDLLVGRKPPGLLLGEGEPAVDRDLEHAAYSRHQLDLGTVPLFQLRLRTEGSWFIVSRLAPIDPDFHCWPLARLMPFCQGQAITRPVQVPGVPGRARLRPALGTRLRARHGTPRRRGARAQSTG
jgi:hypothetical protein